MKLFVVLMLLSSSIFADEIDWNDKQLEWRSYEQGMIEIKNTGKPALFVIYADWCSTCKQYSKLFRQKKVVNSLAGLVLIRENMDKNPELSKAYDFDGQYVPRSFALNSKGQVVSLLGEDKEYQFFLPSNDADVLISVAEIILENEQ